MRCWTWQRAALLAVLLAWGASGQPVTYQGELAKNGQLVEGAADLVFRLYDAPSGGTLIAGPLAVTGEPVARGRFTVSLDFGAGVFQGEDRWVEIDVRSPAGSGSYVTLGQRQPVTAAPVALYALDADTPWQTSGSAVYYTAGNVGIGSAAPVYPLYVSTPSAERAIYAYNGTATGSAYGLFAAAASTSGQAVFGMATAATGTTYGVYGRSSSTAGRGVYGFANASTGTNFGLYGRSTSNSGYGVYGIAAAATGTTYGVYGESSSSAGFGVVGVGQADSGFNYGVYGRADGDFGVGVHGWAGHASGTTRAIYGRTESPSGYAGYFEGGRNYFEGNVGIGTAEPAYPLDLEVTGGTGARFVAHGSHYASVIYVHATDHDGGYNGIEAHTEAADGIGVIGTASAFDGLNYGVLGKIYTETGAGIYGLSLRSGGSGIGVLGRSDSSSGYDFYADGAGVNYGSSSSIRWKHNITPISDPLGRLSRLRGVYFDWDADHGGHHDVGMIAEEVGKVLPEVVVYEDNGVDAQGMDYSKLSPLLVEAVNALRAEKDAEIAALRAERDAEIAVLRDRLSALEQLIARLAAAQTKESAR